jgi:hypothetical protein
MAHNLSPGRKKTSKKYFYHLIQCLAGDIVIYSGREYTVVAGNAGETDEDPQVVLEDSDGARVNPHLSQIAFVRRPTATALSDDRYAALAARVERLERARERTVTELTRLVAKIRVDDTSNDNDDADDNVDGDNKASQKKVKKQLFKK